MTVKEGAFASFVGWEEDGRCVGDRCFVLSDEGRRSQVRWVTGALTDKYDMVFNEHLVSDTRSADPDDDPWTFEAELVPPKRVTVACRDLREKGGDDALLKALSHEGHLDTVTNIAVDAAEQMFASLKEDPAWSEIATEIGNDVSGLMVAAVRMAIGRVLNEETIHAMATD